MRYGVCVGLNADNVKYAAKYGFDYVEASFALFTRAESENYNLFAEYLNKHNIKCETANNFFPGTIKTTGEEVDLDKIKEYVEYGMNKAQKLGVKTVVFGSGGSREVPEGFCYGKAIRQLVNICQTIVSPIAEKYGITVVIEPLSNCNIINTVKEAAILSSVIEKDNIKSLGDLYHMIQFGDKVENIKQCKGILKHSHISRPDRGYPSDVNEYDYKNFIDTVESIGCESCSIEGRTPDFAKDAEIAIKVLRAL